MGKPVGLDEVVANEDPINGRIIEALDEDPVRTIVNNRVSRQRILFSTLINKTNPEIPDGRLLLDIKYDPRAIVTEHGIKGAVEIHVLAGIQHAVAVDVFAGLDRTDDVAVDDRVIE